MSNKGYSCDKYFNLIKQICASLPNTNFKQLRNGGVVSFAELIKIEKGMSKEEVMENLVKMFERKRIKIVKDDKKK